MQSTKMRQSKLGPQVLVFSAQDFIEQTTKCWRQGFVYWLEIHSNFTPNSAPELKHLSQTENMSKGCVSCFIKGK